MCYFFAIILFKITSEYLGLLEILKHAIDRKSGDSDCDMVFACPAITQNKIPGKSRERIFVNGFFDYLKERVT
jgi:hypothetical protein